MLENNLNVNGVILWLKDKTSILLHIFSISPNPFATIYTRTSLSGSEIYKIPLTVNDRNLTQICLDKKEGALFICSRSSIGK